MTLPSKQLHAKIMAKHPNDADAIYAAMEGYTRIREDIAHSARKLEAEETRHEKAIDHINNEREIIQKRCDHPDLEYHGDASGNGDSFDKCRICGKEL